MNQTQTQNRASIAKRLTEALSDILSPSDRELFTVGLADGLTDAEIAAVFGFDAVERFHRIKRGIGKALCLFEELAVVRKNGELEFQGRKARPCAFVLQANNDKFELVGKLYEMEPETQEKEPARC